MSAKRRTYLVECGRCKGTGVAFDKRCGRCDGLGKVISYSPSVDVRK